MAAATSVIAAQGLGAPTALIARLAIVPLHWSILALVGVVVALALPVLYLIALLGGGLSLAAKEGISVACLVPMAFATMHAGYAAGMIYGLWAAAFQPGAWSYHSPMASLSR